MQRATPTAEDTSPVGSFSTIKRLRRDRGRDNCFSRRGRTRERVRERPAARRPGSRGRRGSGWCSTASHLSAGTEPATRLSAQAPPLSRCVLSHSWNLTGFGLPPVTPVTASALAAVIQALAHSPRPVAWASARATRPVLVIGSGIVADAMRHRARERGTQRGRRHDRRRRPCVGGLEVRSRRSWAGERA